MITAQPACPLDLVRVGLHRLTVGPMGHTVPETQFDSPCYMLHPQDSFVAGSLYFLTTVGV